MVALVAHQPVVTLTVLTETAVLVVTPSPAAALVVLQVWLTVALVDLAALVVLVLVALRVLRMVPVEPAVWLTEPVVLAVWLTEPVVLVVWLMVLVEQPVQQMLQAVPEVWPMV